MTGIPRELFEAFHATRYIVHAEGREIVLRAEGQSEELRQLLMEHGVSSCAFLTAFNPYSEKTDSQINAANQQRLLRQIRDNNWKYYEGEGRGTSPEDWREPSFLILGISLAEATELAKYYQQTAFLYGQADGATRLEFTVPLDEHMYPNPQTLEDTEKTCRQIIQKAHRLVLPQFRLHPRHGIHGVSHWCRVWFHGRKLAREVDVNPQLLAWFAFLHDSQRENEDMDPGHGQRAADFATRLRRDSILTELSPTEFEHLCEAMRLHSDGHTIAETAIMACWDADRLDLARAGITPSPHKLCLAHSRDGRVIDRAVRMAVGTGN